MTEHRTHSKLLGLALGATALTAMATTAVQADQVILDDLIVDGSLCVGVDCVNGESFGFDTIRLKENNLRQHFDDTSTAASFPDNDWRFIANDSANGGAEYMAIEDSSAGRQVFRVEAGAQANAIFAESNKVGLGEGNPSVELHITDGDTPTVRLEQDGSSGFTPQTWDLAGNETNFFIRDVTNGSKLPFRIRPNAPTSSIDVANDGDVGLGDSSPDARLDIEGSGTQDIEVKSTDNNAVQMRLVSDSQSRRLIGQNAAGNSGSTIQLRDAQMRFLDNASGTEMARITLAGIETFGTGLCVGTPCDAVFDPAAYTVPSIEDHAALMWQNGHLPAVGPTLPGQPINLGDKLTRVLNELEHAHIYIEQLNGQLTAQAERIEVLEARVIAD